MTTLDSQAADIVKWAEKQTAPANSPKYDRLKQQDLDVMLAMHRAGKPQTEIAQTIGCSQGTVSKWLATLTDRRSLATEYLQAQSFKMAKNIVKNGLARDHVQVLNGLGVLNQQDTGKISIVINGLHLHGTGRGETDQPFVDGQLLSPSLSSDTHSLTVDSTIAKGNIKPLISTTESTPSDAS